MEMTHHMRRIVRSRIVLGPLLATYNEVEGTRLRMTITSKDKLEPKLPPMGRYTL